AALPRERDVENDDVDFRAAVDQLQRFLCRARLAHDLQVRFVREHLANAGTRDRVIVDDQDADRVLNVLPRLGDFGFSLVQHQTATSVSSPSKSPMSRPWAL